MNKEFLNSSKYFSAAGTIPGSKLSNTSKIQTSKMSNSFFSKLVEQYSSQLTMLDEEQKQLHRPTLAESTAGHCHTTAPISLLLLHLLRAMEVHGLDFWLQNTKLVKRMVV